MGKIIPSQENAQVNDVNLPRQWASLAQLYLSQDSSRTEQTNTANAIIATGLQMLTAPRPDLRSYDECTQALRTYFTICAERNVKPTITATAQALGMTRQQFLSACETGSVTLLGAPSATMLPNDVWQLLIDLRENFVSMIEGFMESNNIHPTSGIFFLKNNGNYKDAVEHNYNVTKTVVDVNALAEKYANELEE